MPGLALADCLHAVPASPKPEDSSADERRGKYLRLRRLKTRELGNIRVLKTCALT